MVFTTESNGFVAYSYLVLRNFSPLDAIVAFVRATCHPRPTDQIGKWYVMPELRGCLLSLRAL